MLWFYEIVFGSNFMNLILMSDENKTVLLYLQILHREPPLRLLPITWLFLLILDTALALRLPIEWHHEVARSRHHEHFSLKVSLSQH